MNLPYQWTSAAIGIALAGGIFWLVRRDRMQVRYALWWLSVAGASLTLGIFPQIVDKVGKVLGIHYPPTLLMVVSLALILIKLLTQDLERTRQERTIRRLVQRLAILEGGPRSRLDQEEPRPQPIHLPKDPAGEEREP